MDEKKLDVSKDEKKADGGLFPKYESPKIVTYSKDEIMEAVGPAQACSPFGGCGAVPGA